MTAVKQIPEILIYEMDNGQPIYYADYKKVLAGELTTEAVMGSSLFQALLVSRLIQFIGKVIPADYEIICNEAGILFAKGSWRLADIAIVAKSSINELHNRYITFPPNTVIEVDTKAALEDYEKPGEYYQLKTAQYLNFGIDKVVWIYTKNQKIAVSTKTGKVSYNWSDEITFIEDCTFCLSQIMQAYL